METLDLASIRLFLKVIQHGGFSKAATALRVPKSTISKAVAKLEHESKTRLLIRSTRSHTLTAAGRGLYEACLEPLQRLEEAQRSLSGSDSLMRGRLKLTAPEDLGNAVVAPVVAQLCREHEGLSFELIYTNEVVDLVREGFDFAIRLGPLRESRLKARRLGEIRTVLVGARNYLSTQPNIRTPQDLSHHHLLSLTNSQLEKSWSLTCDRSRAEVRGQSRITSNQMSTLIALAEGGAGIALVPSYLCQSQLREKRLQRILPQWEGPSFAVSLVSPVPMGASGRWRVVGDVLAKGIAAALTA